MADEVAQLIRAAALSSLLIETLAEFERRPVSDEQAQTLRQLNDRLLSTLERTAQEREQSAPLAPHDRLRTNVIPLPSRP